jgi:hypothetical protein
MSDFGVEMRNADNTLSIGGVRTFARLVSVHHFLGNQTATISVPEFDHTKGAIGFYPKVNKFSNATARVAQTTPESQTHHVSLSVHYMPDINWDNTAKTLSVSPPSYYIGAQPDYVVTLIHYS